MQMLVIEMLNIFRKHYRDKKIFLTPYVIRFGKKGHHVYELSTMHGDDPDFPFKVHVLTQSGEDTGLSNIFKTEEQAETYISQDFYVKRPTRKPLNLWV